MISTPIAATYDRRYESFRDQLHAKGLPYEQAGEVAWILACRTSWTRPEQELVRAAWLQIHGLEHDGHE